MFIKLPVIKGGSVSVAFIENIVTGRSVVHLVKPSEESWL